ncbi:methylated-DNA--[protein]-cysteine S-methyltransferase [Acidithiobacillus ferruginosus]
MRVVIFRVAPTNAWPHRPARAAMLRRAPANGANPIGIVIPCHRVIGSDGTLTGYAGGIERKRWLLRHEGGDF